MADGWFVGQVDLCDLVGSKEDSELAISCQRSDGDALAAEGAWNVPEAALEADVVLAGADRAHDLMLVVFHLGQATGHGANTLPITTGRHLLIERFMRAIAVVDLAPLVEGALHLGQVAEP